jgi:hypothetical protein
MCRGIEAKNGECVGWAHKEHIVISEANFSQLTGYDSDNGLAILLTGFVRIVHHVFNESNCWRGRVCGLWAAATGVPFT